MAAYGEALTLQRCSKHTQLRFCSMENGSWTHEHKLVSRKPRNIKTGIGDTLNSCFYITENTLSLKCNNWLKAKSQFFLNHYQFSVECTRQRFALYHVRC